MSKFITAIEIGSSKVKGAIGILEEDGSLNITAIEEQPLSLGSVRFGCIVNVEEVSSKINAVKKLLENNSSVSPRKITGAYIALGGRSLATHPAESSKTFSAETEISENIIVELRERVRNERSNTKEVLDVVPVNYIIDGKNVQTPIGTIGYQIRARYNLVVCDEKNNKTLKIVFDKCKLRILGGITRILAIDSLLLSKEQRELGCILIDFGAETTTVAIYKDNSLRYLSVIPMGSRLITKDIATLLSLSEDRAENLKINHVNLLSNPNEEIPLEKTLDNIDCDMINNIARARASEIISNIAYQIEQSHIRPEDIKSMILVGKGSRLNGFKELLQQNINIKIVQSTTNEPIHSSYNLNIPVSESLDVVAVLAALAQDKHVKDCTEMPIIDIPIETEHKPKQKSDLQKRISPEDKKNGNNGTIKNFWGTLMGLMGTDDDGYDSEDLYNE